MQLTGPILIVDDESHVRLYISLILRALGPVVIHQAAGGEAAIAMYHSLCPPPGLVMLDINMPGIDGIETLRRLRAEGATCPIVMLTSLATRQVVEDAVSAGGNGFIRKDTPKAEIAALLMEIWKSAAEAEDNGDSLPEPERAESSSPAWRAKEDLVTARRETAWDQDWFRGGI